MARRSDGFAALLISAGALIGCAASEENVPADPVAPHAERGALVLEAESVFGVDVPAWRTYEDLRIDGRREDLSGFPFGFLVVLPSGTMAFAEWQDFRVRLYDSAGAHIGNLGRRGGGPGEFGGVRWRRGIRASFDGGIVGDSVWVYDQTNRRVTVFAQDGRVAREVSLANGFGGVHLRPEAILPGGNVLAVAARRVHTGNTSRSYDTAYVYTDFAGARMRRVAPIPSGGGVSVSVDVRPGETMSFGVPFTGRLVHSMAPDGNRIAFGTLRPDTGSTWLLSLTVIAAAGDTLVSRDVALAGRERTDAELDRFLQAARQDMQAVPGGDGQRLYGDDVLDELDRKLREAAPRTVAAVSWMVLGVDNSIWLLHRGMDSVDRFLILDPEGEPVSAVALPGHFVTRQVSRNHAWGFEYDADGFPSIVRYRVGPRDAEAPPGR